MGDIWIDRFPAHLKDRAPRVFFENGGWEVELGGRRLTPPGTAMSSCAFECVPGMNDIEQRMKDLNAEGVATNLLQFVDIFPLDEDLVSAELGRIRRMVVVEQNYTGQLAHVLRGLTGRKADQRINKYDGRPLSPDEIVAAVVKEGRLVHV